MSLQPPVDAPSSADEDFEIPETTMVEVVEEVMESIKATRPTKAETRMEGKNKRVFYVNRKVAIMEEVHLKNSGKSLQEQLNHMQKILKTNVEKVGHIEERGATQGDIDALARQKCDNSEVNLLAQRIESRVREGLSEKYDTVVAEKALKKMVRLADLKERVKAFVTPVVYTIIGEKLPEAVEETKNGLVQLVKRMFDVDPDQRADMENVSRLIKQNESIMANAKFQAETHAVEVAALQAQVADAIAEVRATAAEKLKEQTDMMKKEMTGMLTTMTDAAVKIQEDTVKRVEGAVDDLKSQNDKVLKETQSQITEKYDTFVSKATDVHEKYKVELDLKYQKDIGSMTQRVERCVEQVKEMGGFFKTIKGRMKEMQSAQQAVNVKVDAMQTAVGSTEMKFETIAADTQDLRNEGADLRKDVLSLDNKAQQITRSIDAAKEMLTNVEANAEESRNALALRIDTIKNKGKETGNKALAKFKNLDSKMKSSGRQQAMQMANQEKLLLDQVRMQSQQEANDLRDVKSALDRRFVEMTSELRMKDREIGALRKQDLATDRQIKRLELKLQEDEDKTLVLEKKVKKMHAGNILQKVLGMMQPKGKAPTAMGNKLLQMAALTNANAQLAEVQSVNTGWSQAGDGAQSALAAAAAGGGEKPGVGVGGAGASGGGGNASLTHAQQSEIKSQLSAVDSAVAQLNNKYVNLKVQVDDEMMTERKRHEAHLSQMKEDLKARHEEELEIQRQDWEERTQNMKDSYESQLSRIHDTHTKVQDQLHEAHAVTSVLQAHRLQAEEMLADNTATSSMSILSDDTEASSTTQQAIEDHSRQVAKAHEKLHREIYNVKQTHIQNREAMELQILESKEEAIEMAKRAALEHADQHIKAMLSNFRDTSAPRLTGSAEETVVPFSKEEKEEDETTSLATAAAGKNPHENSTRAKLVGPVESQQETGNENFGKVIMTSQKHQDHRIDILLKKQMVAGREIGLLRQALLELEALVVQGAKSSINSQGISPKRSSPKGKSGITNNNNNNNNSSPVISQIQDAAEKARSALIGVATEANEAMKRVVAQTSRVEAFVRKHENEDRRLRVESEYKHLKEMQQMQRLNQAHKMKGLLDQQQNSNTYQKTVDSLEQKNQELREEFQKTKRDLLAELKQTRLEKQASQMMAQRMSEKQTSQRMQDAAAAAAAGGGGGSDNGSNDQIGNFIGRGGRLRSYSRVADELGVREVLPEDQVPVRVVDSDVTLQNSLEIIGARTPNVPYTASEAPTDGMSAVELGKSAVDHGFDRQPLTSAGSLWSDRPPSGLLGQRKRGGSYDVTPRQTQQLLQQSSEEVEKAKQEEKQLREEQEARLNESLNQAFSEINDRLGEADFGSRNNRTLIAAMNERFVTDINRLKKNLSNTQNVRALEAQMQQLIAVVGQIQNSASEVTDLKSENALLELELKRRSPRNNRDASGKNGASPYNKQRRVMQLANSQSDPNFSLPAMFNVQ